MLDLKISQGFAQIGLQIKDAQYELSQKKADVTIQQVQPNVIAETIKSNLEIDHTPRLKSMGYGNIWFMIQSMSLKSDQKFQENLEKIVQIGRRIGEIEKNPSIGNIVFEAMAPPEQEVTIAATAPLKIRYTPGDINFRFKPGEVNLSSGWGKVSMEGFTFPSVRVFLEKEPYLDIKVVGESIDLRK